MKKIMIFVLISICLIIITIVIMMLSNPLFLRSERQIRSNILKLTPIGMSINEVVEVVRTETEWEVLRQAGWEPLSLLSEDATHSHIYERAKAGSMRLSLGRSFGYNFVSAVWKFDDNGQLIEVTVKREMAI